MTADERDFPMFAFRGCFGGIILGPVRVRNAEETEGFLTNPSACFLTAVVTSGTRAAYLDSVD